MTVSLYTGNASGKWVGLVVCVGRLPTAARDVIIVERTRRERGLIWSHTQVRVSIFLHYFHTSPAAPRFDINISR